MLSSTPDTALVSVVIPCFNVEAHVAACLESVLSQRHPAVQVLVVDDGSTDGTVSEVERVSHHAPGRIELIHNKGRGAGAARNLGIHHTSGPWIQFLDADDRLLPGKLEHQMALVNAPGAAHLVVGDYLKEYPDGHTETEQALYDQPWMGLIGTRLGTTSANLWSRAMLQQAGGWNEELASSQDYELAFRMLKHNAVVVYDRRPHTVVLKRTSGSISQTNKKENWLRYLELRSSIRTYLEGRSKAEHAVEIDAVNEYMYSAIHLLAGADPVLANDLYRRYLPSGFSPRTGPWTNRLAHRVLGFRRTVHLNRLLKGG